MRSLFILIFCISLMSTGCSIYHVNSEETLTDYIPPKTSVDQVVYLEKIDRPHETVGYITVNTERNQRLNDVIARMRYEASILGADAITDIHTNSSGVWQKLPAQKFIGNGYVRANFRATAVVFK